MDTMTHTHQTAPLSDVQMKQLTASLHEDRVSQRDQGRTTLSYLEAWDVKATLIRIFGFGGFDAEAQECEIVRVENNIPKTEWVDRQKVEKPIEYAPDGQIVFGTANFRVTARVRVRLYIKQLDATYTEWAASSQTGPDLGEVTDFAIKTAESDALKRAAIYLGTQFGLSLYNNGAREDVVKVILAPGQEWRNGQRYDAEEIKRLRELAAGGNLQAGDTVARPYNTTDEQHAANQSLLNQALSARAAKDAEADAPGEDYQQHVTADRTAPEHEPQFDSTEAVVDAVNQ